MSTFYSFLLVISLVFKVAFIAHIIFEQTLSILMLALVTTFLLSD